MRGDGLVAYAVAPALKGAGDGDVTEREVRKRRLKVCPVNLVHLGQDLGDGAAVGLCAFLLFADLVKQAHDYSLAVGSPASAGISSTAG